MTIIWYRNWSFLHPWGNIWMQVVIIYLGLPSPYYFLWAPLHKHQWQTGMQNAKWHKEKGSEGFSNDWWKCGKPCSGKVFARQMGEEQLVLVLTVTQVCVPSMVSTYQEESKIPQIYCIGYILTLFNLHMVRNMQWKHSNKNKTVKVTRKVIAFQNNTSKIVAYLFLKRIKEMLQKCMYHSRHN